MSRNLYDYIASHPIVYVTRNFERAIGLPLGTPGYFIITNSFPGERAYIEHSQGRLLTISSDSLLDTHELLEHPLTLEFLKKIPHPSILVFKNTPRIERTVAEHGLPLLNPKATLATVVEDKLSQVAWLKESVSFLPPHRVRQLKALEFPGTPIILQFNHAHSGEGTTLVQTESELALLQRKFPDREVRATDYIRGPVFTQNIVVSQTGIFEGNVSYQITGVAPFTDLPFATVGNDWGLPKKYLSKEHRIRMREFAENIGTKLRAEGYRGLFGIDVILDAESNKLYLLEINARQPASTSYESILQKEVSAGAYSIFEAHLSALLDLTVETVGEIRSGAQLIQRSTDEWRALKPSFNLEKFHAHGFTVFPSKDTERNSEVLRIQSRESVMESHGKLNEKGREIISLLPLTALTIAELSEPAKDVLLSYLHLPLGQGVACPYFNNRSLHARAALRANIGKGSPTEIVDEARAQAKIHGLELKELSEKELQKFLVDHHLGIDCSGFAYHVLDAESVAQGNEPLKDRLTFSHAKSFVRKAIIKFRPAENANVAVFADPENSIDVPLREVAPGDFIVLQNSGLAADDERDHLVIISKVERDESAPKRITYTHSIRWSEDGAYSHGVREGTIEITDPDRPPHLQRWIERGKIDAENQTWQKAQKASSVTLRRLRLHSR